MTFANHNQPAMGRVVRSLVALSLTLIALLASRPALALDTGDIVVASIKGEVHIAVRGTDTTLRAGAVLELPATVRTGRDGAIELRQGATSISVGPDTLLEFPALATPGGSIDRIVQPRGNAFYNVGKRSGRKLRIETPFLVGVVKGTQFSVVAQDHATNDFAVRRVARGAFRRRQRRHRPARRRDRDARSRRDRYLRLEDGGGRDAAAAAEGACHETCCAEFARGRGWQPGRAVVETSTPSGNVVGEPISAERDTRHQACRSPRGRPVRRNAGAVVECRSSTRRHGASSISARQSGVTTVSRGDRAWVKARRRGHRGRGQWSGDGRPGRSTRTATAGVERRRGCRGRSRSSGRGGPRTRRRRQGQFRAGQQQRQRQLARQRRWRTTAAQATLPMTSRPSWIPPTLSRRGHGHGSRRRRGRHGRRRQRTGQRSTSAPT